MQTDRARDPRCRFLRFDRVLFVGVLIMSENNHFAPRPCEVAPHSHRDRLERLISESGRQLIDSDYVSQTLGITKRQASSLLREFIGGVA
jgi:hypothetical protein